MSPKRLDRAAPPPVNGEWEVRFGTNEAARGWGELCTQASANTRAAFELMRVNPRPPKDADHYQLRGQLATRSYGGRSLEQWQVKVSGSGRIWYLPGVTGMAPVPCIPGIRFLACDFLHVDTVLPKRLQVFFVMEIQTWERYAESARPVPQSLTIAETEPDENMRVMAPHSSGTEMTYQSLCWIEDALRAG